MELSESVLGKEKIKPETVLFFPFKNYESVVMLFLVALAMAGSLLFLFVNESYRKHFVDELLGIYPAILSYEYARVHEVKVLPEQSIQAESEFFQKKASVSFFDEKGRETLVTTGVKSITTLHDQRLADLGLPVGSEDRISEVFISKNLSNVLFGKSVDNETIYLRGKRGQLVPLTIKATFELANQERWLLIDYSTLKKLELAFNIDRVLSFYPTGLSLAEAEEEIRSSMEKIKLLKWYEILPLMYRCAWEIISKCFLILIGLTGTILLIFLYLFLWSSYLEMRNIIAVLRSQSCDHYMVVRRIFIWALLFIAATVVFANCINLLVVALVNKPELSINPSMYFHYLLDLLTNPYVLQVSFLAICILFFVIYYDVCRRQVAHLWRDRLDS